jgi:arabinofuranan 3-O-arabinosyltransferase
VLFTEVNIARTTDPYTGRVDLLPVGVSEIVPLGVPDPRRAEDRSALVGVGCDAGPVVQAGSGGSVHFSVTATRGELLAGDQVAATACVSAVLDHGAGQVRVDVPSTALFQPLRLTIAPAPWPAVTVTAGAQPSSSVVEWGSDHRIVRVSTGSSPALLRVTENANAGWVATLDGRTLQATKADGWQQAWVVPAGASGDVVLDYVPDRTYRGGLLGGLFAVLLLAGLALVRPRVRGRRLAGTGPVTLEGRASRRAVLVVQAVALLALGGWPGLAVYAAVLVVVWLLPVRGRWWGAAAVAALVLAAAVPVLRAPWPTFDYAGFGAPVQLLVAAALSCALVTARVRPGVMWRNRKSGRSTSQ